MAIAYTKLICVPLMVAEIMLRELIYFICNMRYYLYNVNFES